ncbi:hypothetical protein MTR_5g079325 [Medicago truncatula]|uniref:Uncharacterized protein n=1 Tax=Medicago truncatula TaxID=3880 RepID=A0A072UGH7_MEDTR|nr:hypothetical protein MTR_5g079325 [Medicago truncatula]
MTPSGSIPLRLTTLFQFETLDVSNNNLSEFPEVVSVIQNGIHKLHTTRSWDFIGSIIPPQKRFSVKAT